MLLPVSEPRDLHSTSACKSSASHVPIGTPYLRNRIAKMRGWIYRRIETTTEISNFQSELGYSCKKYLCPSTTEFAVMTPYDPDSTRHETE